MKKLLVNLIFVGALALILLILVGCGTREKTYTPHKNKAVKLTALTSSCSAAAPTTAAGYQRLFNSQNPAYWSGADGAIAIKMPTGLIVWLWSDTLSTGRFVHNSAIVQDKGCTHVSYKGAQLLPNESSKLFYWIDSVRAINSTDIHVRARQIYQFGPGAWDFKSTGVYKTALVRITIYHNAAFKGWIRTETNAAPTAYPYTKTLMQCAVRHYGVVLSYPTKDQLCPVTTYGAFSYNPQAYSFIPLTSGKLLLAVCFNSNDALTHPEHYRPHFYEINR